MIHSEYTRSLNCNYQRILLAEKPEERKYQYCILNRGGIKGLLPCDLRYINGDAYLYYDITSKQNLAHIYKAGSVTREWLKDFLWSIKQVQQELGRFLLDTSNILWYPEQIYRNPETETFCFLYMPYYEGDSGFEELMEFLVERIDYDDELLVDCVYHMYEQQERMGIDYLQSLIFEDVKCLEEPARQEGQEMMTEAEFSGEETMDKPVAQALVPEEKRKGFLGFLESKRSRNKKQRAEYQREMHREMAGFAVAEELRYQGRSGVLSGEDEEACEEDEEKYGRTIYVESAQASREVLHRVLTPEGKLLAVLDKPDLTIGKKKGEVDLEFEEASVSRIHARIILENGQAYLEDLNSTNGTYKNGLRLQPYEKRRLDEGDELRCGRVSLIFR